MTVPRAAWARAPELRYAALDHESLQLRDGRARGCEQASEYPRRQMDPSRAAQDLRAATSEHTLRERRRERDHVEIEIGRRFQELVVTARWPTQEVASLDLEHDVASAEASGARYDQVELGFGMKVTGAPVLRGVAPDLGAPGTLHGKRLV